MSKILYKQNQEIKQFLLANKDVLHCYNWTMNDDNKIINYYDANDKEDIKNRINLIDKLGLKHIDKVFVSDKNYTEARREVEEFYNEMYGESEAKE